MAAALIESISNSARGPHPLNKIKIKKGPAKRKEKKERKEKESIKEKRREGFGASTIKKKKGK